MEKKVRMRLNKNGCYESEETHLQIKITHPGIQAVILFDRGKGLFKEEPRYADEDERDEFLFEHAPNKVPFCGKQLIRDCEHLKRYLRTIDAEKLVRSTLS